MPENLLPSVEEFVDVCREAQLRGFKIITGSFFRNFTLVDGTEIRTCCPLGALAIRAGAIVEGSVFEYLRSVLGENSSSAMAAFYQGYDAPTIVPRWDIRGFTDLWELGKAVRARLDEEGMIDDNA